MSKIRVLLAGETWVQYTVHQKGFNAFTTGAYEEGQKPLSDALKAKGVDITLIKNHDAASDFPFNMKEIGLYDVVVLSDIGSDTLLLPPDTFSFSRPTPDRLELIKDFVDSGGGFAMIGGYLSFQGYGGSAHYRFTPVEDILPVELYDCDDRVEKPSGFSPEVVKEHEITKGLPKNWPMLLGYNKVKPRGEVLVNAGGTDPLLVVGKYGKGRTAAYTSDCSPHWGSPEFVKWDHYGDVWYNIVKWLAGA